MGHALVGDNYSAPVIGHVSYILFPWKYFRHYYYYCCCYYYYYTIWMSLVTGLFFLVLLLNQR